VIRRPNPAFDLVIAGAGPAGLATAIHARINGLRVVVVERRSSLMDKACGEGIMPDGAGALQTMGVRFAPHECRSLAGIRYIAGELVAEGRFRRGPGLGVQRTVVARRLLERAREVGAEIRFDCPVEAWESDEAEVRVRTAAGEIIHGRLLVGADGLHSNVRRGAGLELGRSKPGARNAPFDAPRRFGVRRHFAVEPWTELVEVHLADGAEAYVTPVAPDVVSVALLFEVPLRGGSDDSSTVSPGTTFEQLMALFPAVERRLAFGAPLDRARGAGPLRQMVRGRVAGRVVLVGDAAGYLDALTGQGLELAFGTAAALVDVVRSGESLECYESAYGRLTRDYYRLTGLLLRATRYRPVRRGLVRLLDIVPGAFDRVLGLL
jgi:2-polyprenyl-6-methoxyphenol hydroxylase-like FAD-dependent oxidoreductase